MIRVVWALIAIISLTISITLNFNATSFGAFLTKSLIQGVIIFGIMALAAKSIEGIKTKNAIKALVFGTLSIVAAVFIVYFGYLGFSENIVMPAITPAHFRTNTLTGECDFGGFSGHVTQDPWYYEPGCELSQNELVEVLKKSDLYEAKVAECAQLCVENYKNIFCSEEIYLGGRSSNTVRCDYLTVCDTISCD